MILDSFIQCHFSYIAHPRDCSPSKHQARSHSNSLHQARTFSIVSCTKGTCIRIKFITSDRFFWACFLYSDTFSFSFARADNTALFCSTDSVVESTLALFTEERGRGVELVLLAAIETLSLAYKFKDLKKN